MKKFFYRFSFFSLTYGFLWVLRAAKITSRSFRSLLTRQDYTFTLGSKENNFSRFFLIKNEKIHSCIKHTKGDFSLTWKDDETGCKVIIQMILGNRKALLNALSRGDLMLEGEGKHVSSFMELINALLKFKKAHRREASGNNVAQNTKI